MKKQTPNIWYFVLPVWGEKYSELLCNIIFPSLLTKGNFPFLKQNKIPAKLLLYTTIEDYEFISQSKIFSFVKESIDVSFIDITKISQTKINSNTTFKVELNCHRHAIEMAYQSQGAIIILNPDAIWSNSFIEYLRESTSLGYRVVATPSLRVSLQGFLKQFAHTSLDIEYFESIEKRKMVSIGLKNECASNKLFKWHSKF